MVTKQQIEAISEDPRALRDAALEMLDRYHAREREHEARVTSIVGERDAALDRAVKAEGELSLTLHRLRLQLAARFGPRIETLDAKQLVLFHQEVRGAESSAAEETILVPSHQRPGAAGSRSRTTCRAKKSDMICLRTSAPAHAATSPASRSHARSERSWRSFPRR